MKNPSFRRTIVFSVLLPCVLWGCTLSEPIVVENAWARPPAGSQEDTQGHDHSSTARTAVYLTIQNNSPLSERLVEISTPAADTVEIHQSWIDDKGIMKMLPLSSIEIPPEQNLVFEPGGYHLMLVGVKPVQAGDTLNLTLHFEHLGQLSVPVEIGHRDR